jgi:hypothetical protein
MKCVRQSSFVVAWIVLLSVTADVARATDRHWNVGSGVWGSAGNWNPSGVPQPTDNAIVDYFNGTAGRSTISTNNVPAVPSVSVLNGDTVVVGNNGSLLCGGDFIIGRNNSTGSLNVTNSNPINAYFGKLTIVQNLRLGVNSGAGTYAQNDGTVVVAGATYLGDSRDTTSAFTPVGMLNLSGGTFNAGSATFVGTDFYASATLNVSGGVGTFGVLDVSGQNCVINQTGGQIHCSDLDIGGNGITGGGTCVLSGGTCDTGTTGRVAIFHSGTLIVNTGSFSTYYLQTRDTSAHVIVTPGGDKVLSIPILQIQLNASAPIAGVVDLTDNSGHFGSDFATMRQYIGSAYNGGAWNGQGLTSSTAAATASSAHKTALGYDPSGFVTYTLMGDVNLDKKVDLTDFTYLAANFNRTNTNWYTGDFNYDGVVDLTDFTLLASNFNQSLVAAAASRGSLTTTVPEPNPLTTLTLAATIVLASIGRRRRCRFL